MDKKRLIGYGIAAVVFILFLIIVIPIIKQDLAVKSLRKQIEEVQLKIELNKEQWNVCKENMELRHTENEENRVIINDLMNQYNEMVGFTQAWH